MCLQDAVLSVRRSLRDLHDPVKSTCHIFSDSTILATFHLLINYIVPFIMIIMGTVFMEENHCPKEKIAQLLIVGGMGRILCTLAKNLVLAKPEADGARSRPYLRIIRGLLDLFWVAWFIASCVIVYRLHSHVSFVKTCPESKGKCKEPLNYCNRTLYLFSFWLLNSIFIFGGACGFTMVCGYYFPWLVGKKYIAANSNSTSNPSATSTSVQYTRTGAGTGVPVEPDTQPIVNNTFGSWV